MIEYWEAIGRMAYHGNLTEAFIGTQPGVHEIERRSVEGIPGLDIPSGEIAKIQDFFGAVLTQGLVSTVAAGELFLAFSFAAARDAIRLMPPLVSAAAPWLFGPSTAYFIGLGILIVDDSVFAAVSRRDDRSKLPSRLSVPERAQLIALAKLPAFGDAVQQFYQAIWGGGTGCMPMATPMLGGLHPIAPRRAYAAKT